MAWLAVGRDVVVGSWSGWQLIMFKRNKKLMAKHITNLQLPWLAVGVVGSWYGWQLEWLE